MSSASSPKSTSSPKSSKKRDLVIPIGLRPENAKTAIKQKVLSIGANTFTTSELAFDTDTGGFLGLSAADRIYLAQAIGNNTHIQKLKLNRLKLDDAFAIELAESIKTYNRTITVINLEGNDIRGPGIHKWAEAIEENKVMIELRLGQQENSHHGREPEVRLVQAVKKNEILRKLTYGWLDDINNQTVESVLTENGLRRFRGK